MAPRRLRAVHAGLIAAVLGGLITVPGLHPAVAEASSATFGTPSEFSIPCCVGATPYFPRATTIADVNRDGIPDHLVANAYSGAVDIRLGHGDGSFGAATSYWVGDQPSGLAVGDLNGDGFPDVVVGQGGGGGYQQYSVLLGSSSGTFRVAGTYTTSADAFDVELGDLNGDGKLDLLISGGDIAVLMGNGDGTFGSPTYYATNGGPISSTIADLNGDGHPDVVVAEGEGPNASWGTVGVFLNRGDGTLGTRVDYTIGGGSFSRAIAVAVGDFTGDGIPDMMALDGNCGYDPGHVEMFAGNGAGGFTDLGSLADGCAGDIALADVTGDGNLDLVSVSPGPTGSRVSVYPGNFNGTFGSRVDYPPQDPSTPYLTFALGDVNRDGKTDVVAVGGGSSNGPRPATVAVYLNTTTGVFMPLGGPVQPKETLGGGNPCHACWARRFVHGAWADPVDAATGNFTEQAGDLLIPGRGLPLALMRTYNSLAAGTAGALGYGWTHSYTATLSQDPTTGAVTVVQENGSQVSFAHTGSSYAPPTPRTMATLAHNSDGTWTFVRQAQETLRFSSAGQLTSLTDRNGYATALGYDVTGHLTSVTDAEGRALTLGYTGSLLTSVADFTGRTVRYAYNDGLGNLTDVTDVNGGTWHYTYDTAHDLLTVTDPRHDVVTTNRYDGSGRVVAQWDGVNPQSEPTSFSYAADGSSTVITDPAGHQVQETYAGGVRMSLTRGYGTTTPSTWTFTYDPATVGVIGITDPNGHSTYRTYDAGGNVLTATDALGRTTSSSYNAFNEPLTVTDPLGVTTTLRYDPSGNLQSRSTPLLTATPLQTQLTTYTYGDPAHPGDVTAVTDPDGKVWTTGYDAYGDVASAGDPLGDTTTYAYNTVGWLQSSVSPRGNVAGCLCAAQHTTHYSYADPQTGQVDQFGDVRTVTDPLGHTAVTTYDADRNVTDVQDGDGNVTHTVYDADNRPTAVTRGYGTSLASTTATDYWPDGTVHDQVDGTSQATTYTYDAQGRLSTVTTPPTPACPASSPCSTTYGYDPAGNLQTVTDAQTPPQTTTYGRDAAGETTSVTYSDGTTPNVSLIRYDADGQRLQMTDGTGTSSWSYDSLHRLTSSQNGAGATVTYGYTFGSPVTADLKDQVRSITYPDGNVATRGYDDAGRMTSVTDWLGHTTTFAPDADSNITGEQYPNGAVATLHYDNADRLTDVTHALPGATVDFGYGRDSANQLTSVSSTGLADSHAYGYTPLNQLSTVDSSAYAYDPAGNALSFPDSTQQTYDAGSELQTAARIWLVGTGRNEASATSSAALTVPFTMTGGTLQTNDYVVLALTIPSNQSIGTPSGYTLVDSDQTASGPVQVKTLVYGHRVASSGEPASATIPATTLPFEKTAVAAVYRGVDPLSISPVEAVAHNAQSSTASLSAGPVATTVPGDRLVLVEGATGNTTAANWATTATMPAGQPALQDEVHESDMALSATALADGVAASAGSWGPATASFGTSANLAAIMLALKPAVTDYGYDRRGNQVSITPPTGAAVSLGYDQANRLTGVGAATSYAYDGDGLRMSKTVAGATEQFALDQSGGLPLLLADGANDFVDGPGGQPLEQLAAHSISLVDKVPNSSPPTATSVGVVLPQGIQANDEILVAVTYGQGATAAGVTGPAGFTPVTTVKSASTGNPDVLVVYSRRATGSESGTSATVSFTTPTAAAMVAAVYRGADPNGAIEVTSPGSANGAGSVTPAATATHYTADRLVVFQGASFVDTAPRSFTPPAGMTEETQANTQPTVTAGVADEAATAPGTVSGLTSTLPKTAQLTTLLVVLKTPPQALFFHQDQLGSTRLLTDEAGAQVASYTFDPYGKRLAVTGTATTPLEFAGQYRDAETGLYYMRARYYEATTAQFLTRDPWVAITTAPYAYSGDNPLNRTDPLGLDPQPPVPEPSLEGPQDPLETQSMSPDEPWTDCQRLQARALPTGGEHPYESPDKSGKPIRLRGDQGFRDASRNRWVWDPKKQEWDVQHPDGSHTNIGEDGNVTHGDDNFNKATSPGSEDDGSGAWIVAFFGVVVAILEAPERAMNLKPGWGY